MRRLLSMLIALGLLGPPVGAVSFYFTPDVPTNDPSGATTTIFLPWDVVRYDPGAYTLALSLPAGTAIDGLHRVCNGDWLFSVESPATGTYSPFFSGAAWCVPAGSDVDAAFLVAGDSSDLVVSFETPTTIGAATPPIPTGVNVTGADRRGILTVMTFDVPATLGATYLPGELVSWDGTTFASFQSDPGWPPASVVFAMSFLPDPGEVPSLRVDKSILVPGNLSIRWAASASAGAEDYGIYEGTIGSWYSHTAIDCSNGGGDLIEEVAPGGGDRYYLVVALNPDLEGSYGRRSLGGSVP